VRAIRPPGLAPVPRRGGRSGHNIHLPAIAAAEFRSYYWCLDQAEVATDVMFRDRPTLSFVLPDLIRHASLNLSSVDVLRCLGRKLHPSLRAQVTTDTKGRNAIIATVPPG